MPNITDGINYERMGYGMTTTVQAEQVSSLVSQRMAMVHKLIAEQDEIASLVEQRLHAVLRPTGPQVDGASSGQPKTSASPIADDLQNFIAQLEHTGARYRDILDRLEV